MAGELQSVAQALRILESLKTTDEIGLVELSRNLGMGRSTAHRLLTTLKSYQYVSQGRSKKYSLGPAMSGSAAESALARCIDVSEPHMRALRDLTGETIHLSTLRGTDTVFEVAIESNRMLRVSSRVGQLIPAHLTAAGQLFLSRLPRQEVERRYPDDELVRGAGGPRTRDELFATLDWVRSHGFGRNVGASETDVCALALPIRDREGVVICSITITGPTSRINPDRDVELSKLERGLLTKLGETAKAIENEL